MKPKEIRVEGEDGRRTHVRCLRRARPCSDVGTLRFSLGSNMSSLELELDASASTLLLVVMTWIIGALIVDVERKRIEW